MISTDDEKILFSYQESKRNRSVYVGWAGWAIAHPGFGRMEGTVILLLAHPA